MQNTVLKLNGLHQFSRIAHSKFLVYRIRDFAVGTTTKCQSNLNFYKGTGIEFSTYLNFVTDKEKPSSS